MERTSKNARLLRNLTLFFGSFLLFTDVFFLLLGIFYDFPLIRYVIYVKIVINTTNLYLIIKRHYLVSTVIFYSVILGFMIVGVISLGTPPGFQLYALGMITCTSYNGYLHRRILKKELPFVVTIAIHVICYAGAYLYARFNEPLYDIPRSCLDILISFNSVASFSIVILYVSLFHNVAIRSEEKLEKLALIDNLTGLYNRHYLLGILDQMNVRTSQNSWLALLDIDDFKKVNDTYGHICGDYILRRVADITKETCSECTVCRWGGEEFIILSNDRKCGVDILETLRRKIAEQDFRFEEHSLRITVTVGASRYASGLTNDGWVSKADEKLYSGKSNGKNQVVL